MSAVTAAVIGGGAALVGGYLQGEAAKDAADTTASASRYAADLQQEQFEQVRSDLAPYRGIGERAAGTYGAYGRSRVSPSDYIRDRYDLNVDLEADPGYQFRKSEMSRAINRAAGGYGTLLSGNRLEEIMARSGDLASQEYGAAYQRAAGERSFQYGADVSRYARDYQAELDYLSRLQNQVQIGQNAAVQTGTAGMQTARAVGDLTVGAANAQAAAKIGQASAYSDVIGNLAGAYGMYQGYQANQPPNPLSTYQLNAPPGGNLSYTPGGYGGTGMASWSAP